MPVRFRRFLPRSLRFALALLFALSVVAQPVLAAVGDMQDLVAHAGAATSSDAHGCSHDAPAPDAPQGDEDALHLLLHYAHCCAAATAVFPALARLPAVVVARSLLLPPSDARLPQALPGHPFRPPIQA